MWEMWSKAWQENSSNWHFYPSRNAPFRLHSIMGGWENGNILILSGGKFKVILSQFKESNISNMWSVKQVAKFQVWAALSIDLESKNCVDPRSKLFHLSDKLTYGSWRPLFISSVLHSSSYLLLTHSGCCEKWRRSKGRYISHKNQETSAKQEQVTSLGLY